jgi:hypothetical protein
VLDQNKFTRLRRLLPGYRPEHDDPEVIARHVCALLHAGIDGAATPAAR